MAGRFEVVLTAFPKDKFEHIERVIHKHNRAFSHTDVHAAAAGVAAGGTQLVATYVEEHAAHNVVKELAYHGATAEVRSDEEAAA